LLAESVVWLCANGRVAEAEQIIRNAAKLNNITMPDKILVRPEIAVTVDGAKRGENSSDDRSEKTGRSLNSLRKAEKAEDENLQYTVLDIFRNRHLTIHLFCISYMWSVKSFNYCTYM